MQKNFIEMRFPIDVSYGSFGGPEYNTEVLLTTNGCEYRGIKWNIPKMRFNIAPGIKNDRQMSEIVSLFRVCKGRCIGFRYKDWSDYKVVQEQVKTVNQNTLQLIKTYSVTPEILEQRIITKPVLNTVRIYVAGIPLAADEFIVDYTVGIITLKNEITDQNVVITADFEFDIPVRFDTDYLPITIEDKSFFSLPEIPIVETKI